MTRFQESSWYVKLWRYRWYLRIPLWFLKTWWKERRRPGLQIRDPRFHWGLAVGWAQVKMNWVYTWDEVFHDQ